MNFDGSTAIVSGSGRGIGRAIALELASHGANVTVTARTQSEIERTADEINDGTSGNAIAVQADLASVEDIDNLFDATEEHFNHLDILVNNAAMFFPFDIMQDGMEAFDDLFSVNFEAALYASLKAAREIGTNAPESVTGAAGRILNISSIHSKFAEPTALHYDIAKGAMDSMTRSLAVELAPYDVLVNGIAPGFIETAMSEVDGENELEANWFQDYYVDQRKIPQARPGQPEEIADVATFLVSEKNTYMTGQTVFVDGGLTVTF